MPFLNILVRPKQNGSLSTTVYKKPTHTDLYLQWDSHHKNIIKIQCGKYPTSQGQTICSSPQLLQQEEEHLHKVLTKCKYPAWALNRVKIKTQVPPKNNNRRGTSNSGNNTKKQPESLHGGSLFQRAK